MTTPRVDRREFQQRLDDLANRYGVPGAAAGVLVDGRTTVVATGIAKLGTTVPVTTDSVFLLASITKVWTATLVLQLVDEGLVDLSSPVNHYLTPPLRLEDEEVARTVTVGQLLTHSGGFFGDAAEPDVRSDDAVEKIVESYSGLAQLHRPGAVFSYSNSGYNVLGRLIECVTGSTWDEALRTRLIEPLGLGSTSTLPEETMTRPLVVGHVPAAPGSYDLTPVSTWLDPRTSGPCGGTLAATPADLLAFARHHLEDGLAPSGARLMSPRTARTMREPHIAQPDPSRGPAWGWGWSIERLEPRIVGHIGSTCGQQSRLVLAPDHGVAVCVMASGDIQGMGDELVSELLRELVGVGLPTTPGPVDADIDVTPYVGRFRMSDEATIDVRAEASGLIASFTTSGRWADFHGDFSTPMTYAGGTTFLMSMPPVTEPVAATFLWADGPGGPATHLASQMRVAPRSEASPR
ncbi:serine hydrolase domain-containing protein [Streptomyces sp. NPDC088910]|uniref:serine hydrolase domain-containing protein n=1 Tax=Streptomyces sp. NPDC088910 TaxID=3365911 RepID=UPI00380B9172